MTEEQRGIDGIKALLDKAEQEAQDDSPGRSLRQWAIKNNIDPDEFERLIIDGHYSNDAVWRVVKAGGYGRTRTTLVRNLKELRLKAAMEHGSL